MANAFEKLTVGAAASGLTAGILGKCGRARIYIEGADIRYTLDGTTPVGATTGLKILATNTFEVVGAASLAALKWIRDAGVDATAQVQYFSN